MAEWLFVSHYVSDNLTLRAGRLRLPQFLFSETLLITQTYNWVRPPIELYRLLAGLHRFNGFSAVFKRGFQNSFLEAEIYRGQAKDELSTLGLSTLFNTKSLYGGRLRYVTDNLIVNVAASDITTVVDIPALNYGITTGSLLSAVGLQFLQERWGVTSEYGNLDIKSLSDASAYYLSLHYIVNQWTSFITFGGSIIDTDSAAEEFTGESLTIGCRYDVSDSMSLKAQVLNGELLDATAILSVGTTPGFDEEVTVISMTLDFIY
ncbi:MAG: hypothetical protein JKY67_22575 [Pseudomonadales bacterium]|nr:hypothetical protein [Pseudomonadales bacterium]